MSVFEMIGQAYVIVATVTFTGVLIFCAVKGATQLQRMIQR